MFAYTNIARLFKYIHAENIYSIEKLCGYVCEIKIYF